MRVGLVSCSKLKLDHPAPARDLYTSQLFRAASAYAEREYDHWWVLSAKYGLVHPDVVIDPYDQTLSTMNPRQIRDWGKRVLQHLGMFLQKDSEVYVHAGLLYRHNVPWEAGGWKVSVPLEGRQIGEQLSWYAQRRPVANKSTG